MQENGDQMDQGLNDLLADQQEGVDELFPNLLPQVTEEQVENRPADTAFVNSIIVSNQGSSNNLTRQASAMSATAQQKTNNRQSNQSGVPATETVEQSLEEIKREEKIFKAVAEPAQYLQDVE